MRHPGINVMNFQFLIANGDIQIRPIIFRIRKTHTGNFSRAFHEGESDATYQAERSRLVDSVGLGTRLGLRVNAGHGLDYQNVSKVSCIPGLDELNIGHAIISRAILVGLDRAVRDMLDQIRLGESESARK